MPHMANLPWLENYYLFMLIFFLMFNTTYFFKPQPNSIKMSWTAKLMKTMKWMW